MNGLKNGVSGLDWKKMVQLSMDGANVNFKLLKMLPAEMTETTGKQMLDIGSCGLHVLNVAFKTGFKNSDWNILAFFRAAYYLFKDSPSCRGTFIAVTQSATFPMKFCSVRWLEISKVVKRALDLYEKLKKFVDHVNTNKMKNISSSASFITLSSALEDKLLRPKIAFFQSVAEDLQPFLRAFQTDCPMAPFLYSDLF